MKICNVCTIRKPLTDFYVHPKSADGYLARCKECHKAAVIKNRNDNIDYYRSYDMRRSRLPHRAQAAVEQTRKWRNEDKRRMKAHNAVARAMIKGILKHASCERCGREESYAHHENYDNVLEVTWLCQPCHKKRHSEMKKEGINP